MPKNHWAPGKHEVDVLTAVNVGQVATVRFGDKKRVAVHIMAGPHGAVDAAGNDHLGLFKKLARNRIHSGLLQAKYVIEIFFSSLRLRRMACSLRSVIFMTSSTTPRHSASLRP